MNPERSFGNPNEAGARGGRWPFNAGAMAPSWPGGNYPALTSQTNIYVQSLNGSIMFTGGRSLQQERGAVGGQTLVSLPEKNEKKKETGKAVATVAPRRAPETDAAKGDERRALPNPWITISKQEKDAAEKLVD